MPQPLPSVTAPLMPKATAVWLIDNTALTFAQIADFCHLHPLEVKGIANGDVAIGIKGIDPINAGQLTRTELERCQDDPATELKLAETKSDLPGPKPHKGSRYTPLSKRQERPDAIAWLVRNHAELNDAEIGRLVGTTKPTIQSVRERTHWNMSQISPVDPVALGLCKQIDLDEVVTRATTRETRKLKRLAREERKLKGAEETTAITGSDPAREPSGEAPEAASPFASLASVGEETENASSSTDNAPDPDDIFK
ncbi:MAG: DUF1013 domain-containing protein [Alphaproteobacteria bacterium]|nr:DUF1013 domain-containing protein [Alphaproteobacteria bacterium]MBE8219719.1 DUF1013 domain-containing protein [Alphaproteobacteria bacterium]